MRIGLVVDATCDLPPEFLAAHGIRVMPIGIRLGEQRLIDRRDPDTTLSFYRDHLPKVGSKDGSQPLSAAELQQWFLDELVTDFDYVVCLTVDSLRSPIFEHATQASFGLLQHYHERRHAAGIAGPSPCAYSTATRCSPASPAWRPRARACWRRAATPTRCVRASNSSASRPAPTWSPTTWATCAGAASRRVIAAVSSTGSRARRWGWARCSTSSRCSAWPMARTNRWRSPSFEKSAEKLFGYAWRGTGG